MNILEYTKEHLLFLDGGMGTLLQSRGLQPGELPERWNLSHPEVITAIHKAYYDAGSHVVSANTFGASSLKFSPEELDSIIKAALENARAAAAQSAGTQPKWVALDIGPLGRLLKPYGDLDFEAAVSVFAETGLHPVPRFSPGYGDFPLEAQKDIFRTLDCSRKIGLTLNESLLMSPSKSVTAIVGLSPCAGPEPKNRCSQCGKTDCMYRRTTK